MWQSWAGCWCCPCTELGLIRRTGSWRRKAELAGKVCRSYERRARHAVPLRPQLNHLKGEYYECTEKDCNHQRADPYFDRGALEPARICKPAGGSGEIAQFV